MATKIFGFIGLGVLVIIIAALVVSVQAWFLMMGWNVLSPLFGGPLITFVQAIWAIVILNLVGGAFKATTSSKSK